MAGFERWNQHSGIEEKALSEHDDYWILKGYAATYETDKINDVIVPGAFKRSLDRYAAKGDNLQLYFNHLTEQPPIGIVMEAFEDRKGLAYVAHLPKDDEFVAKRIVPQIKRRSLKSNSFGFKVRDSERRKSDNARLLKQIDIMEISVVGFPCGNGADITGIKGLTQFVDLPVNNRVKTWDSGAALKRLHAKFGGENGQSSELKNAYLYVNEEKSAGEWDARLLVCDVDENGCLYVNPVALYKSVAAIQGARSGVTLPEEVDEAVKSIIDRHYQRLDLESPFKSISLPEFQALDVGEREARLRSLGISRALAKSLLTSGPRDADRNQGQRDAVSKEVSQKALFEGFGRDFLIAIQQASKDMASS